MAVENTILGIDGIVKAFYNCVRTHILTYIDGRGFSMTDSKTELVKLILESNNIEQAIMTATAVILAFLKPLESNEQQDHGFLEARDQTGSPS